MILGDAAPWQLFRVATREGANGDLVPFYPDDPDWTGVGGGRPEEGNWSVRLAADAWPVGHRDHLVSPDGRTVVVETAELHPRNGDPRFAAVAHVRVTGAQLEFTPYPRSS